MNKAGSFPRQERNGTFTLIDWNQWLKHSRFRVYVYTVARLTAVGILSVTFECVKYNETFKFVHSH